MKWSSEVGIWVLHAVKWVRLQFSRVADCYTTSMDHMHGGMQMALNSSNDGVTCEVGSWN